MRGCEVAGLLDEKGVVQQVKRLRGERGGVTFAGDGGGFRQVEGRQLRRHRIPQQEEVDSAMRAGLMQRRQFVDEDIAVLNERTLCRLGIQIAGGGEHGQ